MDKHLHIVCFDVPFPPDYGGVTDVFYKIKALHQLGIKIHLHCFEYGRGKQIELNKYCEKVNYYKRKKGLKGFSFRLPYIVNSRANKQLLKNLLQNNYPVLLEGIHCTYFLFTGELKNKKVFVRLHNVEYEYYHQLAKSDTSFFKNIYFKNESRLLKKYEKKIAHKAMLISLTEKDAEVYKIEFNADNIQCLPPFLPYATVTSKEGKGDFCLYHGNLSVIENEKAAIWLLQNIFCDLNIPFSIAGKNPSEKLLLFAKRNKNVTIIQNPSETEMGKLISNAQINIIPSFNSTGIKIKLLNALFTGRHCIVNKQAVDGTELESLCHIASGELEFKALITTLFNKSFMQEEKNDRSKLLETKFNNKKNARQLIDWIWTD
ncbi:MAG: glycosyltransferase [Bacteroidota bacterium]|nr:glycosyltransferase [Bacteroidota bacterium]